MRGTPGTLSADELTALLQASPNAVVLFDDDGRVVYGNPTAESLFGPTDSVDALLARAHPDDAAALRETLESKAEGDPSRLTRFRAEGEDWRYYETAARRLGGPRARTLVGLFCSPRPSADTMGRHDGLTQLPNRTAFIDRLQRSLGRARQRPDYSFALLVMDLDRFSFINNTLGARGGDEVLTSTAARLLACVRPGDMVARIGSAQFAVIADHMHADAAADAGRLAERIQNVAMTEVDEEARVLLVDATRVADRIQRQALGSPFALGAHEVFASASIGITVSVAGYEHAEEMFRDADVAMHRAKAAGGARYEIFDRQMHARASERLRLETDLRRAQEREQFRLYYQPIVALDDQRITGFEALLRWAHPERGLLEPNEFLEVAEETGVLPLLSPMLMREACRQVKAWRAADPAWARLSISVNLSGHTFEAAGLLPEVERVMQEAETATDLLVLELTEGAMVRNVEGAAATLASLKKLGVEVHIDDFGTGYSSLSYLHRLPIAAIKIDQSFTQRVATDTGAERMVRTIVELGHSLDRTVIAEGIETREQLEAVRRLGCDLGQGFLFSPPAPALRAEAILRRPPWKGRAQA